MPDRNSIISLGQIEAAELSCSGQGQVDYETEKKPLCVAGKPADRKGRSSGAHKTRSGSYQHSLTLQAAGNRSPEGEGFRRQVGQCLGCPLGL